MGASLTDGMPLELFSSGEPRWLGVQFNRAGESEQPRLLLVSVPYALKAADADTLGGKPVSAFVLNDSAEKTNTSGKGGASAQSNAKDGADKVVSAATAGDPGYIGKFTNTTDLGN